MSDSKQIQLRELRIDTKIVALQRVQEALKHDTWSDVAKLGKDAYAACVKEEISEKEERKLRFAMILSLGDDATTRKYVESEVIDLPRSLPEGKVEKKTGKQKA